MRVITPGFVTNHEIDGLLGGGHSGERHRQRLQEQGRLPEPRWLRRIDRFRVAVYPVFALAGLLDSLALAEDARERLSAASSAVLGSAAYDELAEALGNSIRYIRSVRGSALWELGAITRQLGELAEPALAEWEAVVREAAESLAAWGVLVSAEFGRVEEEGPVYAVSLSDGPREQFNRSCVAAGLHKGSQVGVEHVRVRGQGLDFVMPALQLHAAVTAPELDWSGVSSADWEEALTRTQRAAATASFDADYWNEGSPDSDNSPELRLPADVPSGREAARRLLAARGE